MKYLSKLLLIIVFVFSSMFFQFCNDGCGSKSVSQMEIKSYVYNQVFKLDAKKEIVNYSTDSIPMSADDTVYIQLRAETKLVMNDWKNNGDLYACDPVIPEPRELGDSIAVITIDNFDATHAAGSDVSEYFRLYRRDIVDANASAYFPLSQFKSFNKDVSAIYLALVNKPSFKNIRLKVLVYRHTRGGGTTMELPLLKF